MIPDMQLALRMLDGVRVNGVQIELYAATRIRSGVVVIHHVTAINPESRGVRLGCELVGMSGEAARTLQLFIDRTESGGGCCRSINR